MSLNGSLHTQSHTSNDTLQHSECLASRFVLQVSSIIVLLPTSVCILYLGFQRWSTRHSSATTMSHTDFFTYNMAVTDLMGVLALLCSTSPSLTVSSGLHCFNMSLNGSLHPQSTASNDTLQHSECLASMFALQVSSIIVLLPTSVCILYLGFQRWSTRHSSATTMSHTDFFTYNMAVADMIGVLGNIIYIYGTQTSLGKPVKYYTGAFLCLSVLYVLIRPRPGEMGGDRVRIHQSKQRAFRTILIIMGVLFLKFGGSLVCYVLSSTIPLRSRCVLNEAQEWLALPSSLVLPLLFLRQHGKLSGCKH
ncbi:hypothetical protein JOB18_006765 [Solea senegalensis]|uniref:Vomeronasal type-1 receptor n=1 Tax=Solea senegalensis TaxID=28829 RepID=A0AAV6QS22_SOLSE|nr:hypothetical protein JOB18_006765 [Solea senegalensis]